LHVLSVPCGIPRELAEGTAIAREQGAELSQVVYHGLDLDPELLQKAAAFARQNKLVNFQTHLGDALTAGSYPLYPDFVTSTGLAEFLNDGQLTTLYRRIFEVLRPGGVFVTSGMQRRKFSEYLLKMAEITVHYRDAGKLQVLAGQAGFRDLAARYDPLGIQCIMVARR